MEPMHLASPAPRAQVFWVLFASLCSTAGWILSALHLLNIAGYAVVAVLMILCWYLAARISQPHHRLFQGPSARKSRRRFQRLFPFLFLAVFALAAIGGLAYPPSNPDGLTQRIPRLLNWLAEGRWHWIDNAPTSFNTRATGFEWMMAPVIALTRTDRWIVLLNLVGFALLPGLTFSVFHRLGVNRRTAWHWMWLVPTGYCFLLQAGSIANDMAGAVFVLAAVNFALRARDSGRLTDVWLSILSAALFTNSKSSNLPLLLPWALAMLPSAKVLLRRPIATVAILCVSALVSLGPVTWFNIRQLGDWSGAGTEAPLFNQLTVPVAFAGNALNLTAQNFTPPVFPFANWWNDHFYKVLPTSLIQKMENSFEPAGAHVKVMEMQLEVAAGLGFGVCALLLLTLIYRWLNPGHNAARHIRPALWYQLLLWAPWVSLLVYMVKTGLSTSARIITPYYALLLPLLLAHTACSRLTRRQWWRMCAIAVFVMAAGLVIINPGRPLFPARTILAAAAERKPDSAMLKKAALLYESYAARWDVLAPLRDKVPTNARQVGFISFISASSIETSLWRPFGSRRVRWLTPASPPAEMESKGIQYVVLGTDGPEARKGDLVFKEWFPDWLQKNNGRIIATVNIRMLATGEPIPWYVVAVNSSEDKSRKGDPGSGSPALPDFPR